MIEALIALYAGSAFVRATATVSGTGLPKAALGGRKRVTTGGCSVAVRVVADGLLALPWSLLTVSAAALYVYVPAASGYTVME